jgi:hypothetical protein
MAEGQEVETTVVKRAARPWSGLFLGLILGLAVAIVLQQAGVWPLDKLFLFGVTGLGALIGILLSGLGRSRVSAFSSVVPYLLAILLIGYGATGFADLDEHGEINGGCTVEAQSDLDTTVVTDTTRSDPFDVDPNGGLSWVASSPAPIMNHFWTIYVDIGGFPITLVGNDVAEPNTDGNQSNTGDVDDISDYVAEVSNYSGVVLRGVFEVGGDIDGEGGACDGFGFVRIQADLLTTLIGQIAAAIGLIALIALLALAFNRTRKAEVVAAAEEDGSVDSMAAPTAAAGALAAAESDQMGGGRHAAGGPAVIEDEADDEVDDAGEVGADQVEEAGADEFSDGVEDDK